MKISIAHQLFFNWTGWPAEGEEFPEVPPEVVERLIHTWTPDGFVVRDLRMDSRIAHITFEVPPTTSPVFLATRAKGRLQHALRTEGFPSAFSRKVSVRSLGYAPREDVERYLANQIPAAGLADPRYARALKELAVDHHLVDLQQPAETTRGRYWYDLHFVLVSDGRYRLDAETMGLDIRTAWIAAGASDWYILKSLAVMPDHAHLLLRGAVDRSPMDIGSHLVRASEERLGHRHWQEGFFVTTVGEYSVRKILRKQGDGHG